MTRVGIIGLGALGSSLGLALRAQKRWEDVTGFDASARVQNEAKRKGAIREGTADIPDLLSDADVVVLAVPPLAVVDLLRAFGGQLRAGGVVTDLATTKQSILQAADRYVAARSGFIGGHPLVHCPPGIANASGALYQGRPWCLTASAGADEHRLEKVNSIVEAAGASPYFVDPAEHDAWVAGVEGLPLLMAAALARVAGGSAAARELARVAGAVFDDATRAAGGVSEGRDMALTNGSALVSWLDRLLADLHEWRDAVAESEDVALARLFKESAEASERWETARAEQARSRGA